MNLYTKVRKPIKNILLARKNYEVTLKKNRENVTIKRVDLVVAVETLLGSYA